MSINDLFYTEVVTLMVDNHTEADEYGIVEQLYETIADGVKASITPLNGYHGQQKYGINTNVTFEVGLDYFENCDLATVIVYEDVPYKVESYTISPSFMCLPKSITYGVKKL